MHCLLRSVVTPSLRSRLKLQLHATLRRYEGASCDVADNVHAVAPSLSPLMLAFMVEERSINATQMNQRYVLVGGIGGLAAVALGVSIFWVSESMEATTRQFQFAGLELGLNLPAANIKNAKVDRGLRCARHSSLHVSRPPRRVDQTSAHKSGQRQLCDRDHSITRLSAAHAALICSINRLSTTT